jgi:hypothetical protein
MHLGSVRGGLQGVSERTSLDAQALDSMTEPARGIGIRIRAGFSLEWLVG